MHAFILARGGGGGNSPTSKLILTKRKKREFFIKAYIIINLITEKKEFCGFNYNIKKKIIYLKHLRVIK
ncbi:hypothetical protein [Cryptosporidium hominis TU502]|uniref:hypothetical protein n=1 Tax=Cryptosporidium hominis (strain TU502) TaxID=353151 RepID=UPI00004534F7|nr:hypothetical protein [Cryptosporidium hominis TU502]